MAMNKDNYVLFYCTDFPIITFKDAASFPLLSVLVILMKGRGCYSKCERTSLVVFLTVIDTHPRAWI